MAKLNRILVVDADQRYLDNLAKVFAIEGVECVKAKTVPEFEACLAANGFDCILANIEFTKQSGLNILTSLDQKVDRETSIYLMSGLSSIDVAMRTIEEGAQSFIPRNDDPIKLVSTVKSRYESEPDYQEGVASPSHDLGIIGSSPSLLALFELIEQFRHTDANVLITGESGTGKELVAQAIHRLSPRAEESFEAINCGAIPETLLESELFGVRKGAFTDAKQDKKGLFEICTRGTLFLDEIAELPLGMQVKLLRALQEREIRPLGSSRAQKVGTRIIAATNTDLEKEVSSGRFRGDLFFRLNVLPIHLPPLRERLADIEALVLHFLKRYNLQYGRQVKPPGPEIIEKLKCYEWPGNIRELQNVVERGVILSKDGFLNLDGFLLRLLEPQSEVDDPLIHIPLDYAQAKEFFETRYLNNLMRVTKGNVAEAARLSGRYRSDIYRMISRHQLDIHEFKQDA